MNKTQTRTAQIYLDENGILHLVMNIRVVVDVEDAIDNYLVIKHITKNKPCVRLIDIRKVFKIDKKAKVFIDKRQTQANTIARAILMTNGLRRSTANFFVKFNSNLIPTKFFINYDEAIEWLKTYQYD
ncbi:MAG: hypothetical protein Q8L81_11395 [Bacteroidota bacterium]|nr:hypothetical protein [Bacteroidota bacterium]